MNNDTDHLWLVTPHAAGRVNPALAPEQTLLTRVDGHRRLRGAYTAAGSLLRLFVPDALQRWPEVVADHEIEILSVAPELGQLVPASRETLASLAIPGEHTRFHSPARVVRVGHGVVDFLLEHIRRLDLGPVTIVIDDVDEADHTDLAFVHALCRRAHPARLQVVVTTTKSVLPDPLDLLPSLRQAAPISPAHPEPSDSNSGLDTLELASRFVAEDGLPSVPTTATRAYEVLSVDERARLHDARADALERLNEPSLLLGAVIYHRELGADPGVRAVEALLAALRHNLDFGFYDAAVEAGGRLRALTDWSTHPEVSRRVVAQMGMALMVLGRLDEVRALFQEGRRNSTDPTLHLQICYGYSMLLTRYETGDAREHGSAKEWINTAIAMCASWPDPQEKAFLTVFHQNALALVEVHLGHLEEALRLVTEGLRQLEEQLPDGVHLLHRSVLRFNQAQVNAALGDLNSAIDEYGEVIQVDPYHPEYYFERASLLRQQGRPLEALADYTSAIRYSPPFAEAYYNRADVLIELGEPELALADLNYVIDLDPDLGDSHLNRANLRIDAGDLEGAEDDLAAAQAKDPDHPMVACRKGELAIAQGQPEQAVQHFNRSLAASPDLTEARAGRAGAWYECGRPDLALTDLDATIEVMPDGGMYFNRGLALHDLGLWQRAVDDFTTALDLLGSDSDVLYRRALSWRALGQPDRAHADLAAL